MHVIQIIVAEREERSFSRNLYYPGLDENHLNGWQQDEVAYRDAVRALAGGAPSTQLT